MALVPKAKKLADANFGGRINNELWQSFRNICEIADVNTTSVLIEYIKACVAADKIIDLPLSNNEIETSTSTLTDRVTNLELELSKLTKHVNAMKTKFSEFVKERDNELLF